jgi:hypothetical protein
MVYDPVRRETVLFGGTDGVTTFGDTWIWDGNDWTERRPAHPPPANSIFGMAFDAGTRTTVMNGGSAFVYYTTWLWNGSDWTEVYDPSGVDWRELQGMSRDRSHVVMFGGEMEVFESFEVTNTTYAWNGASWFQQSVARSPSKREAMGMAYDVARNQVVLFGGTNYAKPLGDTWTWDGATWTPRPLSTHPRPRERMGFAYDSARQQIVMFGGTQNLDQCFFDDTWTWDGVTWTER